MAKRVKTKELEWLWCEKDSHESFALRFDKGVVVEATPLYRRFMGRTLDEVKSVTRGYSYREYFKMI